MKPDYIFMLIFILLALPFTASAQNRDNNIYIVAEAGTVQNSMALSGDLASLTAVNNSGGSFGVAIGYRSLFSNNFIAGIELSIASSSASSSVSDDFDTIIFAENYVAGAYLTAGLAFDQALIYGMLGVGSVGGDISMAGVFTGSQTIEDKGNGISFGGAFEYGISDTLGVRVKALHTRYKGEVDELKIRDTSIMGGLVYSF